MGRVTGRKVKYLLVVVFVATLTIFVSVYRKQLSELGSYGYAGIFVACLAANSTVFLPAPSSAIVLAFASVFSPVPVAIAGGLGAALGEVAGYIAGYSGRSLAAGSSTGVRAQSLVNSYGVATVFAFAFLPLPLFDLVGVAAGATRMNFIGFILACVLGKLLKMLIYAYIGAGVLPMLEPLIKRYLGA